MIIRNYLKLWLVAALTLAPVSIVAAAKAKPAAHATAPTKHSAHKDTGSHGAKPGSHGADSHAADHGSKPLNRHTAHGNPDKGHHAAKTAGHGSSHTGTDDHGKKDAGHASHGHGEPGSDQPGSEAKPKSIDETLDHFVREGVDKSFRPPKPKPKTVKQLELEQTEEFIANTNLLKPEVKHADPNEAWDIKRHWFALRSARELRQGSDPQQAIMILVKLLESLDAPKAVKGQALYELGLAAQQAGKTPRAFQIFSQFVHRFSEDPRVPEALYRQGVLQREMGAKQLALSKFYSVLSTSLKLKDEQFGDYEELVLKAQTEIADTHFAFGDYELAADFYKRLLALRTERLDKGLIHYKRIRSLWRGGDTTGLILAAREFISTREDHHELPEVRFLLANSLQKLGRNKQALEEVLTLLKSQQSLASTDPGKWMYWQQRTGNTIANELYQEGDYLSALEIYLNLSKLNTAASWQLPVWYQTGLVYERLQSPQKADAIYRRIVERKGELGETPSESLKTIVEMAEWRANFLRWQLKAETDTGRLLTKLPSSIPLPEDLKPKKAEDTKE